MNGWEADGVVVAVAGEAGVASAGFPDAAGTDSGVILGDSDTPADAGGAGVSNGDADDAGVSGDLACDLSGTAVPEAATVFVPSVG